MSFSSLGSTQVIIAALGLILLTIHQGKRQSCSLPLKPNDSLTDGIHAPINVSHCERASCKCRI